MLPIKCRCFLRHSKLAGIWIYGVIISLRIAYFEQCFLFSLPSIKSLKNWHPHFEMQESTIQYSFSIITNVSKTWKYYQLGLILGIDIISASASKLPYSKKILLRRKGIGSIAGRSSHFDTCFLYIFLHFLLLEFTRKGIKKCYST